MNNINRHNTLKLAQINKLVKYHIEGDQGLNHCGYMLMNSTVNDFISIVKIIIALECIAKSYCFYLLHTTIDNKRNRMYMIKIYYVI